MGEPDVSCATRVINGLPDLAFGTPAGCSRTRQGLRVSEIETKSQFPQTLYPTNLVGQEKTKTERFRAIANGRAQGAFVVCRRDCGALEGLRRPL